jgi:8-oxo-dGTP pyrophosphatase MutT (NUDIX family)
MKRPLPSQLAHDEMMSYKRPSVLEARNSNPPARESAVMMMVYEKDQTWFTLIIERTSSPGAHSGQLAFPGGKLEPGESHLDAAMRETHEEVGIEAIDLEVLGPLTELYIPPSHFVVAPFVALLKTGTIGSINASEVKSTIEVPLAHFETAACMGKFRVHLSNSSTTIEVPGFTVGEKVIWGATAMMIQEFRHLMHFTD